MPGIWMSLKTTSIDTPAANTEIASAALAASTTKLPEIRRYSATALRMRTSSSTTKTTGWRASSSACDFTAFNIGAQHRVEGKTPLAPDVFRAGAMSQG